MKNNKTKSPLSEKITKISQKVIADAKLSIDFLPEAIKEGQKFEVAKKDEKNRLDLTKLALCTIDGPTAKDFDDAVFAKKAQDDIEVVVAIADVSHYVKENSHLDMEARSRSTSVYYPGHVIPMLPFALSNDLCSLKPDVKRLSLSVSFLVGKQGSIKKPKIHQSIIKSKARLTYEEVEKFLKEPKKDIAIPKNIKPSLKFLKEAALRLRKKRVKRGAIDFDITESVVTLDKNGEPLSILPESRLESHRIIEDLMVATNEIVAEFVFKKKVACIYRVHEAPSDEKIAKFFTALFSFGLISDKKNPTIKEPKDIQKLIKVYEKSKYKETLNILMLRSMMQALYREENLGHFGLASKAYLHFTSPIRRYADLIVHRQLRKVLWEKKSKLNTKEELSEIAKLISDNEAKAVEIERKIHRIYQAAFMIKKLGQVFLGTISACTEFGMFVRIKEHHVEGLVHISAISESYVSFLPEKMCLVIEGSNERFMVGDQVKIKLVNVSLERGFIDFELLPENLRKIRQKGRR